MKKGSDQNMRFIKSEIRKFINQSKINKNLYYLYLQNSLLSIEMSTGPFARTSRNTPQRNIHKSQQATEANITSPQISNTPADQSNKGGYVYRPPTRIARTNVTAIKQTIQQKVEKVQPKKQETTQAKSHSKPLSFVRKPATESFKQTGELQNKNENQIKQVKEEVKASIKPITRSSATKLNDQLTIGISNQKKQQPSKTQDQQISSPKLPGKNDDSRRSLIVEKPQIKSNINARSNLKVNKLEETVQQTPKFNLTKNQENENISASNLQTPRKNIVHLPVQKVVSPLKSLSITQRTPSKSTIPQAERGDNSERKAQTQEKNLIKRSPIIAFSLHRLFLQKAHSIFDQIHLFSKHLQETKLNQKSHQYVERTLLKFVRNYQKSLERGVLGLMKSINGKAVKMEMTKSIDPKISNQLIQKRNQCFARVFENIVVSESIFVKIAFKTMKQIISEKKTAEKKIQIGAKVLGNIESMRMRQYLKQLSEWSNLRHQLKGWMLVRCSQINIAYKKLLIWQAFKKIQLFKLKQLTSQTKPSSQATKQLLKSPVKRVIEPAPLESEVQTNKELKSRVSELESKLCQLQRSQSQVLSQSDLRNTIQELKQDKHQNSLQLEARKQRNIQLKKKLESLMQIKTLSSQQEFQSLSENKQENEEPTLSLLHEIYMKTYKQDEKQCIGEENINSLYSIHRVEENKQVRQIVAKWLAVQENLNLKHQINLYEGCYVTESNQSSISNRRKAHKQLEQETQIIKKFIRSYIKERYMWEEVKQYVAAVITQ